MKVLSYTLLGLLLCRGSLATNYGKTLEKYIGLWQAIDTFDGTTMTFSITCDKKECDVRLNDSYRSDTPSLDTCLEGNGRFFAWGTGKPKGQNKLAIKDFTFVCAGDPTNEVMQKGDVLRYDNYNKVLSLETDDEGYRYPPVFHKISCN